MEWVETTGRTLDEAKELALDELGVDDHDAEFEVLEEPRSGLFGRTRGEARVRARVRPSVPRAKADRRERRKRKPDSAPSAGTDDAASTDRPPAKRAAKAPAKAKAAAKRAPAKATAPASEDVVEAAPADDDAPVAPKAPRRRGGQRAQGSTSDEAGSGARTSSAARTTGEGRRQEGNDMGNDATVEEQATITRGFVEGLVAAFGYEATIDEERIDEDTIELRVDGTDLGLLVGPKGQTLQAIQELSRTVVQRQASGTHFGRVRLDVAGYRQRRKEALERFTQQVAASVLAEGVAKALEPMHPADRKVVHDTVNDIPGVRTTSEGEDARRRVVILPDGTADASSDDEGDAS